MAVILHCAVCVCVWSVVELLSPSVVQDDLESGRPVVVVVGVRGEEKTGG